MRRLTLASYTLLPALAMILFLATYFHD